MTAVTPLAGGATQTSSTIRSWSKPWVIPTVTPPAGRGEYAILGNQRRTTISGGVAASPVAPGQPARARADRAGDGRAGPVRARPKPPRSRSSRTMSRRARSFERPDGRDPQRDDWRAATATNRSSRRGHTSRSAANETTSRPTPGIPRSPARWAPSPDRSPDQPPSMVPSRTAAPDCGLPSLSWRRCTTVAPVLGRCRAMAWRQ